MIALLLLIATIDLRVDPSVCLEPCTIKASITITGYEPSREVCLRLRDVELDSGTESSRQSCWPWTGRKVTDVSITNIPAGTYEVSATLTTEERAMRTLRVGTAFATSTAMLRGVMVSVLGGDLSASRGKEMLAMLRPSPAQLDDALRTFPRLNRSQLRMLLNPLLPRPHETPSLQERGAKLPISGRYQVRWNSYRAMQARREIR